MESRYGIPALSRTLMAASAFCCWAVEAPSFTMSPRPSTAWIFRLVRLFATHLVWLAITCGKYCASFCVSGKRMKVKSGGVTCCAKQKMADKNNVETARRTRRGTVTLLEPGKLKLLDGDAKPLLRAVLFLYFYTYNLLSHYIFVCFRLILTELLAFHPISYPFPVLSSLAKIPLCTPPPAPFSMWIWMPSLSRSKNCMILRCAASQSLSAEGQTSVA